MKSGWKKYRHFLWVLLIIAMRVFYFLSQRLITNYHTVGVALDKALPFVPIFVIPYIIWYLYVPIPLLYMGVKNKRCYYLQLICLLIGQYLSLLIFFLYPTQIVFRPQPTEKGIFYFLCRVIFQNDKPVNVFPSLHCYEAVSIYLTTFHGGAKCEKKWLKWGMAALMALICLSTLLIKQHSVLDLLAGCILAVVIYAVVLMAVRLFQRRYFN